MDIAWPVTGPWPEALGRAILLAQAAKEQRGKELINVKGSDIRVPYSCTDKCCGCKYGKISN